MPRKEGPGYEELYLVGAWILHSKDTVTAAGRCDGAMFVSGRETDALTDEFDSDMEMLRVFPGALLRRTVLR